MLMREAEWRVCTLDRLASSPCVRCRPGNAKKPRLVDGVADEDGEDEGDEADPDDAFAEEDEGSAGAKRCV